MSPPPPPQRTPPDIMIFGWLTLPQLKTFGYLVSTISVVLLAIVSFPKAKESAVLLACPMGGVATSIIGICCRWLSYEVEKRRKQ